MSILQTQRKKLGFTQKELALKTGLSLRTIQRLEATDNKPKGHTLKVLSDVFNVEPSSFHELYLALPKAEKSDILSIKMINISALALFGIPFGNIIFPIIMWRRKRQSELVDEAGRKIINFQIIWTATMCLLLCISPFIAPKFFIPFPLILIVLFIAIAINLIVVCHTAILLQRNNLDFLNLPIRFL